jgi:hypothetical protein
LEVDRSAGSDGWVNRLKRIHDIVHTAVADEIMSIDSETSDDWKNDQACEQEMI